MMKTISKAKFNQLIEDGEAECVYDVEEYVGDDGYVEINYFTARGRESKKVIIEDYFKN